MAGILIDLIKNDEELNNDLIGDLIMGHVDINALDSDEQLTPLQFAAYHNKPAAIRALLAYKPKLNLQLEPALHIAIAQNHTEIVKILIDAGAALDPLFDDTSSLRVADQNNDELIPGSRQKAATDSASQIPQQEFSPNPIRLQAIEDVVSTQALLTQRLEKQAALASDFLTTKYGMSPLAIAVSLDDIQKIDLLMADGADPNIANEVTGDTVLHLAIRQKLTHLAKALIERGADEHALTKSYPPRSPLQLAVETNQLELVRFLFEKVSESYRYFEAGELSGVMIAAVKNQNVQLVQLLIDFGMDVNECDANGFTPILQAVSSDCDPLILKALFKANVDLNRMYFNGQHTALSWAAVHGQYRNVKILIAHGINVKNKDEQYPSILTGLEQMGREKAATSANKMREVEDIDTLIKLAVSIDRLTESEGFDAVLESLIRSAAPKMDAQDPGGLTLHFRFLNRYCPGVPYDFSQAQTKEDVIAILKACVEKAKQLYPTPSEALKAGEVLALEARIVEKRVDEASFLMPESDDQMVDSHGYASGLEDYVSDSHGYASELEDYVSESGDYASELEGYESESEVVYEPNPVTIEVFHDPSEPTLVEALRDSPESTETYVRQLPLNKSFIERVRSAFKAERAELAVEPVATQALSVAEEVDFLEPSSKVTNFSGKRKPAQYKDLVDEVVCGFPDPKKGYCVNIELMDDIELKDGKSDNETKKQYFQPGFRL